MIFFLQPGTSISLKKNNKYFSKRYTKALEVLKDKRKEQLQQIKEYKLRLETIQTHQDNANRLKKELEESKIKVEEFNKEIEKLKEILIKKNNKINEMKLKQTHLQVINYIFNLFDLF